MAMTTCKECGAQVSTSAPTCPQCGAKTSRASRLALIILGSVMALVGLQAAKDSGVVTNAPLKAVPPSPEQQLRDQNDQLLAHARSSVLAKLKDPASAQFDGLQVNPRIGSVCGMVNARNSFGGYTGMKRFIAFSDGRVDMPPDSFYLQKDALDIIAQMCDPNWVQHDTKKGKKSR